MRRIIMDLRRLKPDSYSKLAKNRPEVLQKNRGYGIVTITINNLTYAIPLRSNMNHQSGFRTLSIKRGNVWIWNGLDYSKALIVNVDDIDPIAFKPKDPKEFEKIQVNKEKIRIEFESYVVAYIQSAKNGTTNTDLRFKFSTLQYFHSELEI